MCYMWSWKDLHVGGRKVAGGLLLPSLGAISWQDLVSGQAQVIVIHAVIRSYGSYTQTRHQNRV